MISPPVDEVLEFTRLLHEPVTPRPEATAKAREFIGNLQLWGLACSATRSAPQREQLEAGLARIAATLSPSPVSEARKTASETTRACPMQACGTAPRREETAAKTACVLSHTSAAVAHGPFRG